MASVRLAGAEQKMTIESHKTKIAPVLSGGSCQTKAERTKNGFMPLQHVKGFRFPRVRGEEEKEGRRLPSVFHDKELNVPYIITQCRTKE